MKKFIVPTILLSLVILSGCTMATDYIDNKKQEIKDTVKTEANKLAETKIKDIVNSKELNLSSQNLSKVPSYVFEKTSIETLDLSNNLLTGALPAEIRFLKNLKVLKANNNLMTGIPAEVGQLSNLETLDLSNNKLTGLPNELGNLKNLKTMNLAGNNYSQQDLDYIKQRLPNTVFILK